MHAMEEQHRSLVKAMIARMRARKRGELTGGPSGPAGHLTSFRNGMSELIDALARAVGPERLATGTPAESITYESPGNFIVHAPGESISTRSVVLATPAWNAAPLVKKFAPDLSDLLSGISGAAAAVVALGFRRDEVAHPLKGFGFLVPRGQGLRILGSLWTSSVFENRAPDDHVLLRTILGGAHSPELVDRDDDALITLVREDLRTAMGITAEPAFSRIYRYPRGIPQYETGHADRLTKIYDCCATFPGLFVAGNSYEGIAVNSCVKTAIPVATSIVASR